MWGWGEATAIETSEMQCPQYHRVPGESLLCRPRRQVLEGVLLFENTLHPVSVREYLYREGLRLE